MLVDDHAAVRAGLQAVLEPEIDLVAVAATDGNEQLWPRFRRTCPDLSCSTITSRGRTAC
jgi:DNA-binding NarL/FixJ family response regulator